ncbi:MAG: hypothetical protein UZ22_OP11002000730 [Microgenomates bacterium OLB23]|nr:MAG: hypothetical protein UZ22_OP11002000730 [Microgenomates bacterium OLB23]
MIGSIPIVAGCLNRCAGWLPPCTSGGDGLHLSTAPGRTAEARGIVTVGANAPQRHVASGLVVGGHQVAGRCDVVVRGAGLHRELTAGACPEEQNRRRDGGDPEELLDLVHVHEPSLGSPGHMGTDLPSPRGTGAGTSPCGEAWAI